MSRFDNPLKNIQIASPCSADWNEMYGDERKRFCGECKLNVYNLSGMSRDAAEALIMNAEGRLCVRFYRRTDGSIITSDCPVGWARLKQRTQLYAAAMASMLIALFTGVLFVSMFSRTKATIGDLRIPFPTPTPERLMGAIALPPKDDKPTSKPPSNANAQPPRPGTPKAKFETGRLRAMADQEQKSS